MLYVKLKNWKEKRSQPSNSTLFRAISFSVSICVIRLKSAKLGPKSIDDKVSPCSGRPFGQDTPCTIIRLMVNLANGGGCLPSKSKVKNA